MLTLRSKRKIVLEANLGNENTSHPKGIVV